MSIRESLDPFDSDGDLPSPSMPGSPTPNRRRHSGTTKTTKQNTGDSSPGSPRRSRAAYGDRYIPNRSGINLQAAFSLAHHEPSKPDNKRLNHSEESDLQKEQDANNTFSTLLKAEIFGDEVPSAYDSSQSSIKSGSNAGITSSGTGSGAGSGASSTNTYDSLPVGAKTPPRTSRSLPVTPNRNMFRYNSPTSKVYASQTGSSSSSSSISTEMLDSQSDIYSVSPVRMQSQRLLLSPRKKTRSISKVPYKILDAPNLADDFYLNLVDWGSRNILGVGLASAVYLWHGQSGKVERLCSFENEHATSVSWLDRGTHLAVGTSGGSVSIYDAETQKRVRTMSGHELRVGCLAWNEHILTSGSRDRTILHRDVRVPQHYIKRLAEHKQEVCGLKWNLEENQLASGSNDNKLMVWDGLSETPLYKFDKHVAAVKAIAWSPHQRGLLASGGGTADQKIRFWNTMTGTMINEVDAGSQVCNLAWSKNSNELVSTHGYSLNQIVIWKYPSLQQVAALTGHTYRVLYLSMSPDGRTVVTGAGDETLRFWNVFNENKRGVRADSSMLDVFSQLR